MFKVAIKGSKISLNWLSIKEPEAVKTQRKQIRGIRAGGLLKNRSFKMLTCHEMIIRVVYGCFQKLRRAKPGGRRVV